MWKDVPPGDVVLTVQGLDKTGAPVGEPATRSFFRDFPFTGPYPEPVIPYREAALKKLDGSRRPLIFFSDYYEIRDNEKTYSNRLLQIKRLMLLPIRLPMAEQSRWIRRRILSFGSPICCPSVTFAKDNLPYAVFQHGFRACEDWQAWEMISKYKGDFLYSPRALMGHRIHEGSETSAIIEDRGRTEEEYIMYRKFWPEKIARVLNRAYSTAQGSNRLE